MTDFTVSQYGTDPNGRPIWMSAYMHDWWEGIVRELGFRPTIVQGAWMVKNGGGADASAGYHDKGGCLDLRVWDLSTTQVEAVVHAVRWGGAGGWIRDQAHGGMDPHFHLVLGSDADLAQGAAWQWINYLNGGDGLTSGGRDYHPRPRPVVQVPPASLFGDWIDMATEEDLKKLLRSEVTAPLRERTNEIAKADRARYQSLRDLVKSGNDGLAADIEALAAEVSDDARAHQAARILDRLKATNTKLDALAEETP